MWPISVDLWPISEDQGAELTCSSGVDFLRFSTSRWWPMRRSLTSLRKDCALVIEESDHPTATTNKSFWMVTSLWVRGRLEPRRRSWFGLPPTAVVFVTSDNQPC